MRKIRQYASLSAVCVSLVGTAASVATAAPQPYAFTNVASTVTGLRDFSTPSINASGRVVFHAQTDTLGYDAAYLWTDLFAPLQTVAEDLGIFSSVGRYPSINASGAIAYSRRGLLSPGIYVRNGATTTTVVDALASGFGPTMSNGVEINDAGRVAFHGVSTGGQFVGISLVPGGPAITLVTSEFEDESYLSNPSQNASGLVAFASISTLLGNAPGGAIITGNGMPTPVVRAAGGSGGLAQIALLDVEMNDAGTIAFVAFPSSPEGFSEQRVYTVSLTGAMVQIASATDAFSSFGNLDVNNVGAVAFRAGLDAGGTGIFTGPDAVEHRVVGTGTSMFGSTVTSVDFRDGLNDAGQIAFTYQLANGVSGVALATPVPEPAALLCSLAAVAVLRRRR